MDLNALALFVESAQAGSLSEAARRTGVPLPTLSRKIRKLEDTLGMRLLERGPGGLVLTPVGSRMLAESESAVAILQQAERSVRDDHGIAGVLRLSLPPHLKPIWPLLSKFGELYPDVQFDVFVTNRRVDLVAEGIDVALRIGDGGSTSYVGRNLTKYRHTVIASPNFLKEFRIEQPQDLQGVPSACWRTGSRSTWTLGDVDVALEPQLVTNDYEHLLSLATLGHVVTEVPPFMATEGIAEGHLVEVLAKHPMPMVAIRLLVVETRAMSPLVREFLNFASETFASALSEDTDSP
ncbi:MAG: LysR family transcriptional regulator [Woeseiaceae bacterium]|nr:LysR family transcriptional regulator [Woeseiaceae bacterium]